MPRASTGSRHQCHGSRPAQLDAQHTRLTYRIVQLPPVPAALSSLEREAALGTHARRTGAATAQVRASVPRSPQPPRRCCGPSRHPGAVGLYRRARSEARGHRAAADRVRGRRAASAGPRAGSNARATLLHRALRPRLFALDAEQAHCSRSPDARRAAPATPTQARIAPVVRCRSWTNPNGSALGLVSTIMAPVFDVLGRSGLRFHRGGTVMLLHRPAIDDANQTHLHSARDINHMGFRTRGSSAVCDAAAGGTPGLRSTSARCFDGVLESLARNYHGVSWRHSVAPTTSRSTYPLRIRSVFWSCRWKEHLASLQRLLEMLARTDGATGRLSAAASGTLAGSFGIRARGCGASHCRIAARRCDRDQLDSAAFDARGRRQCSGGMRGRPLHGLALEMVRTLLRLLVPRHSNHRRRRHRLVERRARRSKPALIYSDLHCVGV